jgi:LysM repeat protein
MQMRYVGILIASVLSASCAKQYVPDNAGDSPSSVTNPNAQPTVLIYDPITGTTKPQDASTTSINSTDNSSTYTIQKGDTVYSIGRAYSLAPADIIAWNGLTPPYALSIGQTLTLQGIPTDAPKPPINLTPPSKVGMLSHTVQKGDTVYSIAKRHGRTPQEIMSWNGLSSANTLQHGLELKVAPSGSGSKNTTKSITKKIAVPANVSEHTVAANETLFSIAKRYGQEVDEVANLNGLSKPYHLTVGQVLRVKAPTSKTKKTKTSTKKFPPPKAIKTVEKNTDPVSDPKPTKAKNTEKTTTSSGFEIVRHKVAAGDSLETIAQKHGQKVEDVGLWNGIAPPYAVQEGQTILIYK